MLANEGIKGNLGILDVLADGLADNETELSRWRQSLPGLWRPRRPKVDLLSSQGGQDELIQTQGGGSVHAGVFSPGNQTCRFRTRSLQHN
jgi:hypothetical protein